MRVALQLSCSVALTILTMWLAVAGWNGMIATSAITPTRVVAPIAVRSPTSATDELKMPALNQYSLTLARPLFVEGRRPPLARPIEVQKEQAPVPQVPTSAVSLSRYRLLGVVSNESGRRALIETPDAGIQWRAVADQVDEWTIVAIETESVALKSRSGNGKLRLYPSAGER